MNSQRPSVPPPPPGVTLINPASLRTVPTSLSQLKYVLFSWTHNPLTKRDPIAQQYFKSKVQMDNFASSLGSFPLTLYEAQLAKDKPVELFMSGEQCQVFLDGFEEKMGKTRTKASWNVSAVHDYSTLARDGGVKVWRFPDQETLQERFTQLKKSNDFFETMNQYWSLKRAQEVVKHIQGKDNKGEARFIAIDIETWERNHDLVTEVGFAKSTWKDGKFGTMETRHFVVEENAKHRNGSFCPDARDHFHFGRSETLPSSSLCDLLSQELLRPSTPVFLLLHDSRSDLKSLQLLGLSTASFARTSPLPSPEYEEGYLDQTMKGKWLLDTQTLYSGFNRQKKQAKLGDAAQKLDISLSDHDRELEGLGGYSTKSRTKGGKEGDELRFHNSGNDAWATLMLFWKLMGLKEEEGNA